MAIVRRPDGTLVNTTTNQIVQDTGYNIASSTGEQVPVTIDEFNANQQGQANSGLAEQSWGDKFASWFTPQGDKGTSLGGNVMGAIGTGVGAASGLAGMYYAKKNFDLQKDQQDYLKNREAMSDARKSQFAANAGGGASYKY